MEKRMSNVTTAAKYAEFALDKAIILIKQVANQTKLCLICLVKCQKIVLSL